MTRLYERKEEQKHDITNHLDQHVNSVIIHYLKYTLIYEEIACKKRRVRIHDATTSQSHLGLGYRGLQIAFDEIANGHRSSIHSHFES